MSSSPPGEMTTSPACSKALDMLCLPPARGTSRKFLVTGGVPDLQGLLGCLDIGSQPRAKKEGLSLVYQMVKWDKNHKGVHAF